MLNSASVMFKTCVHLAAGVKKWVESPTDRSYPFIVATKENIQKDIKDNAIKKINNIHLKKIIIRIIFLYIKENFSNI